MTLTSGTAAKSMFIVENFMKLFKIMRLGRGFSTVFLLASLLFSLSSCSGGTNYVGTGGGTSGGGSYTITVKETKYGTVETDKESADKGDKITLTVKPIDGYKLDVLMVDGKDVSTLVEAGKYSFTMSDHDVTVEATFTTETKQQDAVTLKTGKDINAILNGFGASNVTQFKKSNATNSGASQYLDLSEEIPVWLDGTTVYYYIPDGRTVYMNADSSKMFSGCFALTSLDVGSFNTSKVTNMEDMFRGCSALTSLDVGSFDTSKVTNMTYMFRSCSALTSLDVGSFNTSSVTDMSGMFVGCSALTSLDVGSFNTSKVTTMSYMFDGCSALTNLNLSSFNTGNVTDMYGMFNGCSKLTNLNLSSFNTGSVTNMGMMFCSCSALTNLNLSSFNTSKVTDMSYMFFICSALTSLDVGSFNTSNVTNMYNMFSNCSELTTIYATNNFVTTSVTSGSSCFFNCTNLRGGAGTTYNVLRSSAEYARIDGGLGSGNEGYFTAKP